MHSRTRRLLLGATLTLLAITCTAALGASTATAAAQAKVHKISACGYVATAPGTYELTKNVADASGGPCITLEASRATLYLDAHTITGTGTDTCLLVESTSTADTVGQTVIGGTKAKPSKSATLTNCDAGLVVVKTSGAKASNLKIVAPSSYGVLGEISGGMTLSNINIRIPGSGTASGVILVQGADNVVTKSSVDMNGGGDGFVASTETGDAFTYDSVKDTYSNTGGPGTGFVDASSSHNTWSHDTSSGQLDGFVFAAGGAGPVTATYNSATGLSSNPGSYGFQVIGAYQQTDYASTFHTLISHNKANGFQYGFYDVSSTQYAIAEKWTNNTADNYSEYGFFVEYPTDYTFTGNIADANTATHKYTSGSTCGICIATAVSFLPFATFSNNQAYDSEYGFQAGGGFIGGKGNIAKHNKYNTVNVEITG